MEEIVAPRLLRLRLVLKLVLLSVVSVGVVFSFSRAAWLNLAVGTVALFVVLALRRGGARRAMTLLAVTLVAGVALFGVVAATSSLNSSRSGPRSRTTTRSGSAPSLGFRGCGRAPARDRPRPVRAGLRALGPQHLRPFARRGGADGRARGSRLLLLTLGFAARNVALGVDTYGIGSAGLLAAWCGLLVNSFFVDTLHWRHLWLVAALIWAGTALRAGYPGR